MLLYMYAFTDRLINRLYVISSTSLVSHFILIYFIFSKRRSRSHSLLNPFISWDYYKIGKKALFHKISRKYIDIYMYMYILSRVFLSHAFYLPCRRFIFSRGLRFFSLFSFFTLFCHPLSHTSVSRKLSIRQGNMCFAARFCGEKQSARKKWGKTYPIRRPIKGRIKYEADEGAPPSVRTFSSKDENERSEITRKESKEHKARRQRDDYSYIV